MSSDTVTEAGNAHPENQPVSVVTMLGGEENSRLSRFNGSKGDDYQLWKLRATMILKAKGYWRTLSSTETDAKTIAVKEKASSIIVNGLGDGPLRQCLNHQDDPLAMLSALDKRYASTRMASQIATLTSVYSRKYKKDTSMAQYIDGFVTLFNELETMGPDCSIKDSQKAPLLLASLGTDSKFESLIAAMMLKDAKELTWDSVAADLIQEDKRTSVSSSSTGKDRGGHRNGGHQGGKKDRHRDNAEKRNTQRQSAYTAKGGTEVPECNYCGRKGHLEQHCFINPDNPNCKLPAKAVKSYLAKTNGENRNSKTKKVPKSMLFGGTAIRKAAQASAKMSTKTAILDSGATHTMFPSGSQAVKGTYKQTNKYSDISKIQLAAGENQATVLGTATVCYGSQKIQNAVHVNGLNAPLLSVGQICDEDKIIIFSKKAAIIMNTKEIQVDTELIQDIIPRDTHDGLYKIHNTATEGHGFAGKGQSFPTMLWHNRLVHLGYESLRKTMSTTGKWQTCHPCRLGKATKKSFDSKMKPVKFPGEIIHSDLAGPLPLSIQGSKYMCTFMDQKTRWISTAGLKHKSDCQDAFEMYRNTKVVKSFKRIQEVHTDGGGEYEFLEDENIVHSTTTPHTPEHNAFSERLNRTLFEPARVLLEQSGLSRKYWEYAVHHVAYIKNRVYHQSIEKSPHEALYNKPANLKHVRVFGCSAFVRKPKTRTKFHARASPGILLGCDDNGVYTVELLNNGKIIQSVHCTFDENHFPRIDDPETSSSDEEEQDADWEEETSESDSAEETSESDSAVGSTSYRIVADSADDIDEWDHPINDVEIAGGTEKATEKDLHKNDSDSDESSSDSEVDKNQNSKDDEVSENSTPKSTRIQPPRATKSKAPGYYANIACVITTTDNPTVNEALNATPDEVELWKQAIDAEFESLEKKNTWRLVGVGNEVRGNHSSRLVKPLPTNLILRIKRDENGKPTKFKARLVVGGHKQIKGIDYSNTYAPVASFALVRLVLLLVLHFGWHCRHVDVTTAFLNGDLEHHIFVQGPKLPPGLLKEEKRNKLYYLIRALYGLHQAPRQWFLLLVDVLCNKMGYKQLYSEGGVFVKEIITNGQKGLGLVVVYVDDMIFAASTEECTKSEVNTFLNHFEGTDEGQLSWYLGVSIEVTPAYARMSQNTYVEAVVKEYNLENSRCPETPMMGNFFDEMEEHKNDPIIDDARYRHLIGCLLFISIKTRPDISLAVAILALYVSKPTTFLFKQAKRVLMYLYGTKEYGLTYYRNQSITAKNLQVFVDADFAGSKPDRKSRSGYCATFGGVFDYFSRKQSTVSLSTTESEYIALSEGSKEASWLKILFAELQIGSEQIKVFNDNQAALQWSKSEKSMKRAKHLDVRFHYVRECVTQKKIELEYCPSDSNWADGFTKPLERIKFLKFRESIGVHPPLSTQQ